MKISIDNETFELIDEGNRDSKSTLMLIQGLGCDAECIWRPVLNEIAFLNNNQRSIAFNVRGIGNSSGWPESLEQMAEDAAKILTSLKIKKVRVVGHSLGGTIAIFLAARYPNLVDSLVLISSLPTYSDKSRSGFKWRAGLIRDAEKVSVIFEKVMPRSFCNKTHFEKPELIEAFKTMLNSQEPETYAHICELAAKVDAWPSLQNLNLPKSVIVGSDDPNTTPELLREFAKKIGARYKEIPNAGHNPPLEQPALIAAAILSNNYDWLATR